MVICVDPSGRMHPNFGGLCLTNIFTDKPVAHMCTVFISNTAGLVLVSCLNNYFMYNKSFIKISAT